MRIHDIQTVYRESTRIRRHTVFSFVAGIRIERDGGIFTLQYLIDTPFPRETTLFVGTKKALEKWLAEQLDIYNVRYQCGNISWDEDNYLHPMRDLVGRSYKALQQYPYDKDPLYPEWGSSYQECRE